MGYIIAEPSHREHLREIYIAMVSSLSNVKRKKKTKFLFLSFFLLFVVDRKKREFEIDRELTAAFFFLLLLLLRLPGLVLFLPRKLQVMAK